MKKINVAELLKGCPSGMELNCSMYENVIFDYVRQSSESAYPIHCLTKTNGVYNRLVFTQYGCSDRHPNAKCVIFPKGKTTWEGFQRPFKDGDIVIYKDENRLVAMILNKFVNFVEVHYHCALYDNAIGFVTNNYIVGELKYTRLATEEEKEKLFKAIKDNGYKWNAETKNLEKLIIPKFKVGDIIKNKTDKWLSKRTIKSYVDGIGYFTTMNDWVRTDDQDDWELVPNIKPRFKVGDRIKSIISSSYYTVVDIKNDLYFIKSDTEKYPYQVSFSNEINYKLVLNKFDINTLIPFESRVLVRCSMDGIWKPAVFGFRNGYNNNAFYIVGGSCWNQCIPYLNNEHLLGTNKDCDEYYKNW